MLVPYRIVPYYPALQRDLDYNPTRQAEYVRALVVVQHGDEPLYPLPASTYPTRVHIAVCLITAESGNHIFQGIRLAAASSRHGRRHSAVVVMTAGNDRE